MAAQPLPPISLPNNSPTIYSGNLPVKNYQINCYICGSVFPSAGKEMVVNCQVTCLEFISVLVRLQIAGKIR